MLKTQRNSEARDRGGRLEASCPRMHLDFKARPGRACEKPESGQAQPGNMQLLLRSRWGGAYALLAIFRFIFSLKVILF